jgi:hypothetical protein
VLRRANSHTTRPQPTQWRELYPALAAWRRRAAEEMHPRFDALWKAAAWEAAAEEAARDESDGTWRRCMQGARDIMREAAGAA